MCSDLDGLPLKTRLLAVEVLTSDSLTGWHPDLRDAISLATDLLVADRDSPATVEVACLDATSSFDEARRLLVEMLTEQGVDLESVREDPWAVLPESFAGGLLSAADLETAFYLRLPAWDSQSPIDRGLVCLFDERDVRAAPRRGPPSRIACEPWRAGRSPLAPRTSGDGGSAGSTAPAMAGGRM